jgi:hypothetical protein
LTRPADRSRSAESVKDNRQLWFVFLKAKQLGLPLAGSCGSSDAPHRTCASFLADRLAIEQTELSPSNSQPLWISIKFWPFMSTVLGEEITMKFAVFLSSLLVATALASTEVGAQNDVSSCVALANVIATGETVQFSSQDLDAMKYYANCRSREENSANGLEIVYESFKFGFNGSDSEKESYCEKSKSTFESSTVNYIKTKTIFQSSLATIDACLRSIENGWLVEYNIFDKDAISLGISNRSSQGGRLAGIDIFPAGSLTCDGMPEFPKVVTTSDFVSMTCTRASTQTIIDGTTVTSAPDATINLRLATKPFPIRLSGYTTSIIEAMRAEINRLSQRLSQLESSGLVKASDLQSSVEGAGFIRFETNLSVRDGKAPNVALSRHGGGGNHVSPYPDTTVLDGPSPSRVWILRKE